MYEFYASGATLGQVAERFGVSRSRVAQVFRAAGRSTRRPRDVARLRIARTRARDQAVVKRVRDGVELEKAAAEFGIAVSTVRQILRNATRRDLTFTLAGRGEPLPGGYWTRERIIEAIRRWNTTFGTPPAAIDWSPSLARLRGFRERASRFDRGVWPYVTTVRGAFGSWNSAIEAAGFEPRAVGQRGRALRM